MSEEYLKSIIDCVSGIECKHETQQIAKYELIEHIEELRKENQSLKDGREKAVEWIYMIQQNKDNKHLEPVICTDELDELLEILKGDK